MAGCGRWSKLSRPATTRRLWIAAWMPSWKWRQAGGAKVRRHRQTELWRCAGAAVRVSEKPGSERRSAVTAAWASGHGVAAGDAEDDAVPEPEGRFWGPGVLDMKAGVAMGLTAIETLQKMERCSGR